MLVAAGIDSHRTNHVVFAELQAVDIHHQNVGLGEVADGKPLALREAESRGVPIFVLKNNTLMQMQQALLSLQGPAKQDHLLDAMTEAEEAIHAVISQSRPVELTPQSAYVRRLQHELVQRFNLNSTSRGKEPQRRVRILPESGGDYFGEEEEEVVQSERASPSA